MNQNLESAKSIAIEYLANFAESDSFWQDFELAFGSDYNQTIALNIKSDLANQTLVLPEIVFVDEQILGNANAAFASENNTIYISQSFLNHTDSETIAATLIEEIGHSIDNQINDQDSAGDEGQIFSSLVRSEALTPYQLATLKSENDHGVINISGQKLTIEQAGSIDYGDALSKSILFYEAQQSGKLTNNRVSWRGDSALSDGTDVGRDLSGGYYDAADYVKFGFPMASAMTMLSWGAIQYRSAYEQSGQLDEIKAAIKHATEYIKKAHVVVNGKTTAFWGQVGDGNIDHQYWTSPEIIDDLTKNAIPGIYPSVKMDRPSFKIDTTHPGSDLAGESAATLAAASILFRPTDAAYADELLTHAKQLFAFAKDADGNPANGKQQGNYSELGGLYNPNKPNSSTNPNPTLKFYKSSGYEDELGWGALWLYKATKEAGSVDDNYLTDAKEYYSLSRQLTSSPTATWTQTWDDKSYGGMVLMAQELPSTLHYKTEVEKWLTEWTTNNTDGSVKYTPGGLAWLTDWGSLRYTANTAFIAGVYADTVNDPNRKYSDFAQSQIEYMLGKNPTGISYMVGFGDKYPQRVHHRAASGLTNYGNNPGQAESNVDNINDIVGGLVGGPTAPTDNSYNDVRLGNDANGQPAYKGNEVALDYNAGFTGALARLYGINNPNPNPTITLAVSPATVIEAGATNLVYTFIRTGNTTNALTVNYGVSGTATLGTDYTQTGATSFSANTGTVNFTAGATTATVTIDPTADTIVEGNETVVLTLANGTGYNIGNSRSSVVLLGDNFDAENNRNGADNYSSLTNWNVTRGSIDLIGAGYKQDLLPNNGLYLDLDGTIIGGGSGGKIESKSNFSFMAGDEITLKFSLAGSQRGDTNTVNVSLGSLFNETFTKDSAKPFDQITRTFTVTSPTNGKLIFDHAGGDNLGLLLDNVELSETTNGVVGTIINSDLVLNASTRNDFDGDGKADILWQSTAGTVALWQMNGATVTAANLTSTPTVPISWKTAGTGDFNGDGKSDMLWRNDNGAVAVWQMNGSTVVASSLTSTPTLPSSWKVAGTGDFNGDRKSDILWRNDNGAVAVWQMNGATVVASSLTSTPTLPSSWKVAGTGDFNGDGKSDILWRNDDGSVALWQMNGNTVVSSSLTSSFADNSWKINGTGDFNGDGKSDILWRNDNGKVAVWQMNGSTVVSSSLTSTPSLDSSWKINGTGDFNGDGKSDILWRKDSGVVDIWQMNGATVVSSSLTSVQSLDNTSWKIAAPML